MAPASRNFHMDDRAAVQFLMMDMLEKILECAENPGMLADYLTHQLRELLGGKVVVLMECCGTATCSRHEIVSVCPARMHAVLDSPELRELAIFAHQLSCTQIWDVDHSPAEVASLMGRKQWDHVIALPLIYGKSRFGVLFVLNVWELEHLQDLLDVLEPLSHIIALVLKNSVQYRDLEQVIALRTQEISEKERFFRTLADLSLVGIFRADSTGEKVTYVNRRISELTGISPLVSDIIVWNSTVHIEDQERVRVAWYNMIYHRELFALELRFQKANGVIIWVLAQAAPENDENGQIVGYVGTVTDITERKALEERLRQSEKLEAIGQLAGGIAHDFNNQLVGIMGYAEILTNRLQDEALLRFANSILKASHRAADLTKNLVAFARKGKYLSAPVNIHLIIDEVISLLQHSLDKRIELKQQLKADNPMTMGDASLLQNALLNLAINARDALSNGGEIIFSTALAELPRDDNAVELAPGSYLLVSVTDTGTGMSPETLRRIFEPFFTTKEVGKGTGLGLSAVYGTVKSHQGGLSVHSEMGRGTSFCLYFPLLERGEPRLCHVNRLPDSNG